jgi:hypothetical protein
LEHELAQAEEKLAGEVIVDSKQEIQVDHPFSKAPMQAINETSGKLMRHEKGTKVETEWLQGHIGELISNYSVLGNELQQAGEPVGACCPQLVCCAPVQPVAEYMELVSLRKHLTEAVQRVVAGDTKAENEVERLHQLIQIHPDHVKEEEEKQKTWEANEGPKCDEARNAIRGVVPVDVFSLTQTQLEDKNVPQEIARRIFTKQVLWFVRMDPEDIAKLHAADLNTKYSNQGLDIVEMRAVYKCLPVDFKLDGDGKKAEWKVNFKQKLMELTRKEENDQLKKHEKRHEAYVKHPNIRLFDTDKLRQKVEVQKGEAFAPQKASARPSIMALRKVSTEKREMRSAAQASKVDVTSGDDDANPFSSRRRCQSAPAPLRKARGLGGMPLASISDTESS